MEVNDDIGMLVSNGLKKTGKTQKKILLWLGEEEGLTTPDALRRRWPPPNVSSSSEYRELESNVRALDEALKTIPTLNVPGTLTDILAKMESARRPPSWLNPDRIQLINRKAELEAQLDAELWTLTSKLPHAYYMSDAFFENNIDIGDETIQGVKWDLQDLLGRPPTRSESASYATALRTLEDKHLVKTYRNKGKNVRVSHVELTMVGGIVSVKLRNSRSR